MKKIISTLLVCVLLVGCVLSLASCGKKLSGKYQLDAGVVVTTYEFKGSKVTVTVAPVVGKTEVKEAKYKIAENNEGDLEIVFTVEGEDPEAFSFAEGKEGDKEYIKIAGIEYVKVD